MHQATQCQFFLWFLLKNKDTLILRVFQRSLPSTFPSHNILPEIIHLLTRQPKILLLLFILSTVVKKKDLVILKQTRQQKLFIYFFLKCPTKQILIFTSLREIKIGVNACCFNVIQLSQLFFIQYSSYSSRYSSVNIMHLLSFSQREILKNIGHNKKNKVSQSKMIKWSEFVQ